MPKALDLIRELKVFDDALLAEVITLEALINILDSKRIIDRGELLEAIKKVHESISHPEKLT